MMLNSTVESTSALSSVSYDSTGAIIYIVVVLLWYSMGIVCLLGMKIKARDETVEDGARRRAKLLIETLRDQTHTKQILEELVDKDKRDRLWDIYLDRTNDRLIHADSLRIRHIEKQLAVINQNRLFLSESVTGSSALIPDLTLTSNRARVRRRSSLDQQIIERWKTLVEQCKTPEQLPWTIQKRMIRRHFRRHYKTMLREPKQIFEHVIPIDSDDG